VFDYFRIFNRTQGTAGNNKKKSQSKLYILSVEKKIEEAIIFPCSLLKVIVNVKLCACMHIIYGFGLFMISYVRNMHQCCFSNEPFMEIWALFFCSYFFFNGRCYLFYKKKCCTW
jgi:hypothetical protein